MNASPREFIFNDRGYGYFIHPANDTKSNERCVEIPLIVPHAQGNVLEVGDVLAQYGFGGHDCIDLTSGNIKQDIRTLEPEKEYDVCVSISTLEHIGEGQKSNETDLRLTLAKLRKICRKLIATIPLGYNAIADKVCSEEFTTKYWMRRTGPTKWEQCGEIAGQYGHPYKSGNVLLIGGWE